VARAVFSLQASSASSERVFSASGLIDAALRNRMLPQTLEKLTVVNFFLKKLNRTQTNEFFEYIHRSISA
jgi:hypothetical protein